MEATVNPLCGSPATHPQLLAVSSTYTNKIFHIHNMRRSDREITLEESGKLLLEGEYGVLSLSSISSQPYGVPINYAYRNNCIYFHCATEGQKLEYIFSNSKVSFCVVGKTQVLPSKFATKYESVIVHGIAEEIVGDEKYSALLSLVEKYSSAHMEEGKRYISSLIEKTKVFRILIEHMSGKARK